MAPARAQAFAASAALMASQFLQLAGAMDYRRRRMPLRRWLPASGIETA